MAITFMTNEKDRVELQSSIDMLAQEITKLPNAPTTEPAKDDVPKVFINGSIPINKDYVLAELEYISKTLTFHTYIKIKCQGTSSLSYPKKNFTIVMYEDNDRSIKHNRAFMNWSPQSKFCLKANWIDFSHARNIVSARLWHMQNISLQS